MPKSDTTPNLSSVLDAIKNNKNPGDYPDQGFIRRAMEKKLPKPKDPITANNIDEYEKETISVASRAIFVLEDALAKWDSLKDKPEDLRPEFDNFRNFHANLVEWTQKILRSRSSGEEVDFYSRVDRLKEYAKICKAHK